MSVFESNPKPVITKELPPAYEEVVTPAVDETRSTIRKSSFPEGLANPTSLISTYNV